MSQRISRPNITLSRYISRRSGLAGLIGLAAGMAGIADIDAKKKKKKKTATVCATGCTYTTLAAAVAATSAGGSICLKNGNYEGGIEINKAMTISNCTIDDVVTITAPEASRVFTVSMGSSRSTLTLTGVGEDKFTLIGLTNAVDEGGIIAIGSSEDLGSSVGNIEMRQVVLKDAAVSGLGGGAIYGRTSGTIRLTDTSIVTCNAFTHGGGIDMNGGTLTLDGASVIKDCNAQQGAGIWLGGGARLNLNGTSVIGGPESHAYKNEAWDPAVGFGGGIYAGAATTVSMSSTAEIRSNKADISGGGIYAEESATLLGSATCTNTSKIANNTLGTGGGVGPQIYHVNHATC